MKTLQENTQAVGSSAYFGDRGNWLIADAVTRDSDCLSRSNWDVFQSRLNALEAVKNWDGGDSPIQIERFNHWAVGWVDYLLIDPACTEAVQLAEQLHADLADYPVLDETHFSQVEQTEADEIWRNCYRPSERAEYVRKHRSQFEFRDMAELIGCIRGKYFAGYASELIS